MFNAYKKETFNLRVVLMWTISDFLAYENMSGCTVKGCYNCLVCGIHACICWLPYSWKMSYVGHRWFLQNPPKPLSSEEVLNLVIEIDNKFGEKV